MTDESKVLVVTRASGVSDSTVAQICTLIGTKFTEAVRLGDRSVEIAYPGALRGRAEFLECIDQEAVDINVVPAENRKKSILKHRA